MSVYSPFLSLVNRTRLSSGVALFLAFWAFSFAFSFVPTTFTQGFGSLGWGMFTLLLSVVFLAIAA